MSLLGTVLSAGDTMMGKEIDCSSPSELGRETIKEAITIMWAKCHDGGARSRGTYVSQSRKTGERRTYGER